MAKQSLGRIGFLFKGEYNSSVSYSNLDVVSYKGSSYVCIKNAIGIEPTNASYWSIIAKGLDVGDLGDIEKALNTILGEEE